MNVLLFTQEEQVNKRMTGSSLQAADLPSPHHLLCHTLCQVLWRKIPKEWGKRSAAFCSREERDPSLKSHIKSPPASTDWDLESVWEGPALSEQSAAV